MHPGNGLQSVVVHSKILTSKFAFTRGKLNPKADAVVDAREKMSELPIGTSESMHQYSHNR
jgi:hypothetical protein